MFRTALLSTLLISIMTPLAAKADQAGCGTGSWIAGTTELCDGVLVYRDYVYDDYGARVGEPRADSIGPTAGKVRYTEDVNSADLIALRLKVEGDELHVSFEMNTLFNPDSTFAALAIDTDNNATTGGGNWADLLAVEQPHGSGTGLPLQSDGWEEVHVFEEGDPKTNLIEGTIPLPQGTTWRVQAVTGIKSRRIVMNVAFREDNETSIASSVIRLAPGDGWGVENGSNYFESQQALVLATTDISRWGAVVEVEKMIQGVTEPAPPATGFHQRVFESAYTIFEDPDTLELHFDRDAEGVSYEGVGKVASSAFAARYNFLGKYQPYGIYIPENATGPHGIFLALHGANQSHSSLVGGPGMQQNVGEAYNNIVATPLARGPLGWYQSIAEREVLEVIADIEANYTVDTNRRYAAGYSMGGYGAFRMASQYPHMFAGFISWNGATTSALTSRGITHRTVDFLKNTRQVPGAMLYAAADELVWIDQYLALQGKYGELQYESILYLHPAADHFTFGSLDDWQKEAAWIANRTLQTQPKQVTYRSYPILWRPEVGVVHDRAYWVTNIVGRDTGPEQYVDINLITYGCGGELPVTDRLPETAGTDPVPWVAEEYGVIGGIPLSQQNRIEGNVSNLESATIDVNTQVGACLSGSAIQYEITTDGETTIEFSDGRSLDLPEAGTWTGSVDPLPNTDPEANDDSADTDLDTSVTIAVLDNDTDADGDLLSVTAVTDAKHGEVSLNSDHSVTYFPAAGFVGVDSFTYDISDNRGGTDSAKVLVYVLGGSGTEGEGRVHGSGHLDRGTNDKYDKIDFSFDARVYKDKGLKGKLKLHDKALDLKIDAKTITSLSTGQGEYCDGLLMDGQNSFVFSATGELEMGEDEWENVSFRACGVDNGKHGKGKDGQPADRFHVEVISGGYNTADRTPDSNLDGGNVHLHDPISAGNSNTPDSGSSASFHESSNPAEANVAVLDLDPLLISSAPVGTPLVLIAIAHNPAEVALAGLSLNLQWVTDNASGNLAALTNATGVAVFTTTVPAGDVSYTVTHGDLDSNGVRITGY